MGASSKPSTSDTRYPFSMKFGRFFFLVRPIWGVSKNRGTPKWMVKIMENPVKMDDLGVHYFQKHPVHIPSMGRTEKFTYI